MNPLSQKHCVPCKGNVPPLDHMQIEHYLKELKQGWTAIDNKRIEKSYTFKNFREALEFTNKVGAIAEEEGHHPDIYLSWGKVTIQLWTHKINGLTESDFIFAAKCDAIPSYK